MPETRGSILAPALPRDSKLAMWWVPCQWKVRDGTARPGVSLLWLGDSAGLICSLAVWQYAVLSQQTYDALHVAGSSDHVGWLVAYPSNTLAYLRDGSAQTSVRVATLR